MQPVVISASEREWIKCETHPYPQDDNGLPFWVTLVDQEGVRRKELVVMTPDDGLCITDVWHGESYGETVTDQVTHWMPQDIPKFPAVEI